MDDSMEMESGGVGGAKRQISSSSSSSQSLYLRLHCMADKYNVHWYRFPIPVDGKAKFADDKLVSLPFSKSDCYSGAQIVGCGSCIYTLGDRYEPSKRTPSDEEGFFKDTAVVYRYNTAELNPKWTRVQDMNICRYLPKVVVLNEKIYVMGGIPFSWHFTTPTDLIELCGGEGEIHSKVLQFLTPEELNYFKKCTAVGVDVDKFEEESTEAFWDLCYKLQSLIWAECYDPSNDTWELFGRDLYPLMDPQKEGHAIFIASAVSKDEMLLVSDYAKKSYLYNVGSGKSTVYHEDNPFNDHTYPGFPIAALRGYTLYCHDWNYDNGSRNSSLSMYAYRYNKDRWLKADIPKDKDYNTTCVQPALLTSASTHDGYHQLHWLEIGLSNCSDHPCFSTVKLKTFQVPDAGPLGESLNAGFEVNLHAHTLKNSFFEDAIILSDPVLEQEGLLTLSVSKPAVPGSDGPMRHIYLVAYVRPLEKKRSKFDSFFKLKVQCKEKQSVTFEILDGDIEQENVLGKTNLDLGTLTDRHEEEFNLILVAPSSDTRETDDEKRVTLKVKVEYRPFKEEELITMELDRAKRKKAMDSGSVDSSLIKSRKLI